MRAVVQRVSSASVTIGDREVARIGIGLALLVGIHRDDDETDVVKMADRIKGMRIFNDAAGKINLNLEAVGGSVLAVSNFTVYGDSSQRRPNFTLSSGFEKGEMLFGKLVERLREARVHVETGEFGADMQVNIVNDGPVTLVVDTRAT